MLFNLVIALMGTAVSGQTYSSGSGYYGGASSSSSGSSSFAGSSSSYGVSGCKKATTIKITKTYSAGFTQCKNDYEALAASYREYANRINTMRKMVAELKRNAEAEYSKAQRWETAYNELKATNEERMQELRRESSTELEQMRTEMYKWKQDVSSCQGEVKQQGNLIEEYKSQIDSHVSSRRTFESDFTRKLERCNEAYAKLQEQHTGCVNSKAQVEESFEQRFSNVENNYRTCKQDLTNSERSFKQLEVRLNDETYKFKQECETRLNTLRREHDQSFRGELRTLENEVKTCRDESGNWKSKVYQCERAREGEANTLRQQERNVDELKRSFETCQNDLTYHKEQVSTFEQKHVTLQENCKRECNSLVQVEVKKINVLQNDVNAWKQREQECVQQLRTEQNTHNTVINEYKVQARDCDNNERQLVDVTRRLEKCDVRVSDLQIKQQEVNTVYNELRTNCANEKRKFEESAYSVEEQWKTRVSDMRNELTSVQNEARRCENNLRTSSTTVNNVRVELQQCKRTSGNQARSVSNELNTCRNQITVVRNEVRQCQNNLQVSVNSVKNVQYKLQQCSNRGNQNGNMNGQLNQCRTELRKKCQQVTMWKRRAQQSQSQSQSQNMRAQLSRCENKLRAYCRYKKMYYSMKSQRSSRQQVVIRSKSKSRGRGRRCGRRGCY